MRRYLRANKSRENLYLRCPDPATLRVVVGPVFIPTPRSRNGPTERRELIAGPMIGGTTGSRTDVRTSSVLVHTNFGDL
jgi:hypothetical protein